MGGFLTCVNLLVCVFAFSVTWLGCGTTHHGHESGVEVRALHFMPTKDTRRLLLAHGLSLVMKNENDEDLARIHEVWSYVKVRSFFVWFDSFFSDQLWWVVVSNVTRASFLRVLQTL